MVASSVTIKSYGKVQWDRCTKLGVRVETSWVHGDSLNQEVEGFSKSGKGLMKLYGIEFSTFLPDLLEVLTYCNKTKGKSYGSTSPHLPVKIPPTACFAVLTL